MTDKNKKSAGSWMSSERGAGRLSIASRGDASLKTIVQVAVTVCVAFCFMGQSGCVILVYGAYGAHTPLRDVSQREHLWGEMERDATYELLIDAFMSDYRHYSFGPALAPGKGIEPEQPGGQWGGPTTAEAYRSDPERWPDVMGLVDQGTQLRCIQLKRRNYVFHDKYYAVFAEILDGPRKGEKVEITELTVVADRETGLRRPDKYLLQRVSE